MTLSMSSATLPVCTRMLTNKEGRRTKDSTLYSFLGVGLQSFG